MSGAQVAMMVNIALGSLFAVAYAIIALSNKSQRRALWFSVGYLLGMAAPACDLIAPLVGAPELLAGRRRLHQFSDGDAIDLGHL
jgi:hypothetical protein